MRAGEHLANQLLPEFKPKNQHARTVFKDRKKVMGKIQQDKVATPPSAEGSVPEMEQLDLWNKWLRCANYCIDMRFNYVTWVWILATRRVIQIIFLRKSTRA
jgi:hypothetical protein